MELLLKGEEIEVPINLETVIVGIENNENNIWGLLLGTGYLKVTDVVEMVFAFKGKDVKIEIF